MLQSGADGRGAAQPNSVLETEEEMQQLGCQACWLFQCVVVDVENEREEREGERAIVIKIHTGDICIRKTCINIFVCIYMYVCICISREIEKKYIEKK
jgi:hypothetical protein